MLASTRDETVPKPFPATRKSPGARDRTNPGLSSLNSSCRICSTGVPAGLYFSEACSSVLIKSPKTCAVPSIVISTTLPEVRPRIGDAAAKCRSRHRRGRSQIDGSGLIAQSALEVPIGGRNDILPVAPTAHVIRCARFLIHTARELGRDADIPGYEADIAAFAHALRTQAWDASAGVFSYTVCDETGHFREIYRDPESGVNYNLGMDGASVLLAGSVCDREQRSRLLELLMTPGRCWSEYGLSTVDMSAPYFRPDGYWNGSIWMPHQWFFWKAMLDLGEAEFASRIAMCALELWKRETDLSCGCFEHFSLSHGRGCGCPHFGALSAPVLCWFAAYFSPGRLTGGFDFWVHRRRKIKGAMEVNCTLGGRKGDFMTLLYVPENEQCTVSYNGNAVPVRKHRRSWLEFELPCATEGTLEITG